MIYKENISFLKNVHSYRPSLFNNLPNILVYFCMLFVVFFFFKISFLRKILSGLQSECPYPHRVGDNQKRSDQSTDADQKSLETVFLIAICRPSGDIWQLKTLFLAIFDLRSSTGI